MHRLLLALPLVGLLAGCARAVTPLASDAATPDAHSPTLLRQLAPLSTATVTSRRPLLHWVLGTGDDGAHVELCRDRACTRPLATFDATGTSAAPADDLPTGVVYWRAHGRAGGRVDAAVSPTWQFTVGARSAPVNTSWGTTLDVNGDGFADVAVADYYGPASSGLPNNGVYLYLGSASGLATTPSATLISRPDGDYEASPTFGAVVASAGDVDGDGFGDLVVAAPGSDLSVPGQVFIYRGSAGGPVTVAPMVLTDPGGPPGEFGARVASAGDVDGDGFGDLVVLEPQDTGRILVYRGGASGLISPPATAYASSIARLGNALSVVSAGDINGDGFGDIAAGVLEGHAFVYLGSDHGLPPGPSFDLFEPGTTGVDAGLAAVANAGDVNGDGYADLVVGPTTTSNLAHVYLGGAAGPTAAAVVTLMAPDPSTFNFAAELASAGDVDGDGFGDVLIGSPGALGTGGASGPGRADLFFGSAAGPSNARTASLVQPLDSSAPPNRGSYGASVAAAGDVDGDGLCDVLVAAPGLDPHPPGGDDVRPGHVYLFSGRASGVSAAPTPILDAPPDGVDYLFGGSVASAVEPTAVCWATRPHG